MAGTITMLISANFTFLLNSIVSATTIISTEDTTASSWLARKRRTVSTSLVQRCTISPRFGLYMIAEGQVLDVLIQPFAQVQRHIFARLALPATLEKVDRAAHNIQPHQRQTNDPQVARHKARAAPAIHPAVDKRRHGGGLAAEIIVQRFGQQQGGQVIDDHADQHAQRRPDKEPFILLPPACPSSASFACS